MTVTALGLRNGHVPDESQPAVVVPDFSLSALVRELREDGLTEPDELAARVLGEMPEDYRAAYVHRLVVRDIKTTYLAGSQRKAVGEFAGRPDGLDRWQAAFKQGRGVADLHGFWVTPFGKEFGECSPDEILEYADQLKAKAIEVADSSQRFRAAGHLAKKRRAKLMRDVPVEKLAEAFYA